MKKTQEQRPCLLLAREGKEQGSAHPSYYSQVP